MFPLFLSLLLYITSNLSSISSSNSSLSSISNRARLINEPSSASPLELELKPGFPALGIFLTNLAQAPQCSTRLDSYTPLNQTVVSVAMFLQPDLVKKLVKPGCSEEVVKVALSSMASLVETLTSISSTPKLHASL